MQIITHSWPHTNKSQTERDRAINSDIFSKTFLYNMFQRKSGLLAPMGSQYNIIANNSSTITIGLGAGAIEGVIHETYMSNQLLYLEVEDGGVLPRYDLAVIRLDKPNRDVRTLMIKGVESSTPIVPSISLSGDYVENAIGVIYRPAGATTVSQSQVDESIRLNTNYCNELPTIGDVDTDTIFSIYLEKLKDLEKAMQDVVSGIIPDNSVTPDKLDREYIEKHNGVATGVLSVPKFNGMFFGNENTSQNTTIYNPQNNVVVEVPNGALVILDSSQPNVYRPIFAGDIISSGIFKTTQEIQTPIVVLSENRLSAIVENAENIDFTTAGILGIRANRGVIVTNYDTTAYTSVTASAYHTASDERLKQNISSIDPEEALSFINSLRPVEYEYISNPDERRQGLIAQEVQTLLEKTRNIDDTKSGIISTIKLPNNDKSKQTELEHLVISYQELIAPMIASIQQLAKRVSTLEENLNK